MNPPAQRRTQFDDGALTLALLGVLLIWDFSGWDMALTRQFGSAEGFVWRDAWLTRGLLHQGGRLLAMVAMAGLLLNLVRPWLGVPGRNDRLAWFAATVACLLAVPTLKQFSATSCPWDLAEFGGVARNVSHWSGWAGAGWPSTTGDGGPGRCFPSGHAVSAFGFLPGYFWLRERHPARARWWLGMVCALGAAFALGQLARGAHHLSHSLWSAWLCWALSAGLWQIRVWASRRARPSRPSHPSVPHPAGAPPH